jgi:hypothetical protein
MMAGPWRQGLKKVGLLRKAHLLQLLLTLITALLAILVSAAPANAHGGGTPQLVQAPSGPYQVYAWTNPDPARAGVLHVTVSLVEPASQQPVLDAEVQILAQWGEESPPIAAPATHENALIKTYYEADIELPTAGVWQITVAHSDAAGRGRASFLLEVKPATFNWRPIGIGAVLALIALGAWFVLQDHDKSSV